MSHSLHEASGFEVCLLTGSLGKVQEEKYEAERLVKEAEAEIERGEFFECGCCFGQTGFSLLGESFLLLRSGLRTLTRAPTTVTCTEGCQFCRDCTLQLVNSQIGLRKFVRCLPLPAHSHTKPDRTQVLPCMDVDGCKAFFPESELRKFLPATTQGALHKLKQEKELDSAEIEGLAKCPCVPTAPPPPDRSS